MNFKKNKIRSDSSKNYTKNSIYIIVPAYILLPSPSSFFAGRSKKQNNEY